jgi:P-type conjugative transfer protein TrbJ
MNQTFLHSIQKPLVRRNSSRLVRRMVLGVLAAVPVLMGAPRTSWGFGIVFDPAIYAKNIQQVAQAYQEISILQQQLQQEEAMLASLNISILPQLTAAENQLASIANQPIYQVQNVQASADNAYPLNLANMSSSQVLALQQQWQQSQRNALVENRQVQDQIVQQMPATTSQVGQLVAASNSAPGATAAVQAGNQIVATLANQMQQLEVLEASDQRTLVQKQAIRQSQAAYADQQRQAVMSDWNTPVPTQPVVTPFNGPITGQ